MIRDVAVYWHDVLLMSEVGRTLQQTVLQAPLPKGAIGRRPVGLASWVVTAAPDGGGRVGTPGRSRAVTPDSGVVLTALKEQMVAFVGRQPELAVLRARLSDALAGRPQIVQIQGPAGIGKTALLDAFLTEVAEPGDPAPAVIWASGEETEELLAYGVVEQLARSIVRPTPELLDDPVTIGARLLEFLDQFDGSPVVLAVDDAHWADRPSLQALIFALRRLAADQVLTVIAVRDDSVAGPAGEPAPTGQRAAGHGAAIARAGRAGPAGSGRGDGHRRHRRERGPPAAVRDAGKSVARHGRCWRSSRRPQWRSAPWGADDQLLPSPLSFRRLVQERYASSRRPTRGLVDAAAVLGPHCPLPLAVTLADVTDPIVALDEAAAT